MENKCEGCGKQILPGTIRCQSCADRGAHRVSKPKLTQAQKVDVKAIEKLYNQAAASAGTVWTQKAKESFLYYLTHNGVACAKAGTRSWYNPMRWIKGRSYVKVIPPEKLYKYPKERNEA